MKTLSKKHSVVIVVVVLLAAAGLAAIFAKTNSNYTAEINNSSAQQPVAELQTQTSAPATLQTQNTGAEKPGAKPGEVGEVLLDQPKKGIKTIRGGTLVTTPGIVTCSLATSSGGGGMCATVTVTANDGALIGGPGPTGPQNFFMLGTNSAANYMPKPEASHAFNVIPQVQTPGTYTQSYMSIRYDELGNTVQYFGSVTVQIIS